jgi:hypothetical protein
MEDPTVVLKDLSTHWETRLAAIGQITQANVSRDIKAKALAVQILDPRSKIASEALLVSKLVAAQLGVNEGAAELLAALLKVASNLRVKGLREQAAEAIRVLCSQQGDGLLFQVLAKAAEGTIKTGDAAQALAIDLVLQRLPKGSQEHRNMIQKARTHKSQAIRDIAKSHAI